jgi:hypothetical protein
VFCHPRGCVQKRPNLLNLAARTVELGQIIKSQFSGFPPIGGEFAHLHSWHRKSSTCASMGHAGTSNSVVGFPSVFSEACSLNVPKFPACYRWNYP